MSRAASMPVGASARTRSTRSVGGNAAALGYRTETRLWASVPPTHLAATGAAVAAHPEVAFCAATTGPTNLLVSIVCRDSRDLYRYLTERLGTLPLIGEIQTAPVIRVIKRAGLRPCTPA